MSTGRRTISEPEAKRVLSEAGIEVPASEVATDADAAVEAAERIGYPVVLKVVSEAVQHKTEWGDGAGVALELETADEVRTAAERIGERADAEGIDAELLVEAAMDRSAGTEVIVGGTRDPSFGPTVVVGLGGVFAEVYEDTAHRLAPLSEAEARAAIDELRARQLLAGYRGRPPTDLDALAAAVAAVGDLLVDRESIVEIDVNPLLARSDGVVALDALIVEE